MVDTKQNHSRNLIDIQNRNKKKNDHRTTTTRLTQTKPHNVHIQHTYAQQQKPVPVIKYQLENGRIYAERNVKWKDIFFCHTY